MARGKDTSITVRHEIAALMQHSDLTHRQIASKFGVSPKTVQRIGKMARESVSLETKRVGNCGRKRATTKRGDRLITRTVLENRKSSLKELLHKVRERGVAISRRTLRRRLKEAGLVAKRPLRKPLLTPTMIRKRLQWAKKYKNWTEEDWDKVIFSDESTFVILEDKSEHVRRRPGEELLPECLKSTVKHPTFAMVWSCISSKGLGHLYIVKGTMRQDQYKMVLEKKLKKQIEEWFPTGTGFTFMHDGAPCHTAKSVSQYLASENIPVLSWPGNSPDLNPIENVWAIVKRRMAQKHITSKDQLIRELIQTWKHDPEVKEIVKNCTRSMPRRVREVLRLGGQRTKY